MTMRRRYAFLLLLLAAGLVGRPDAAVATTGCAAPLPRPGDQIWAVSTRHLGSICCPGATDCDVKVRRYEGCQRWAEASVAEFYAWDDTSAITCVYVHAARVDQELVTPRAMGVYRSLVACQPDAGPVRLVIWCWPADKTLRPLQDFRCMAARSDSDAYYLGRFLEGVRPDAKVSLVGYSMGARIITGALHLLGGGAIAGRRLNDPAETTSEPIHARAVLWAPAVHSTWLWQGCPHGNATAALDSMLVFYNPCDPVLARYASLEECSSPSALGYVGLRAPERLGEGRDRVVSKNVACAVGKQHQYNEYLASPYVTGNTRQWALWHPLDAAE